MLCLHPVNIHAHTHWAEKALACVIVIHLGNVLLNPQKQQLAILKPL